MRRDEKNQHREKRARCRSLAGHFDQPETGVALRDLEPRLQDHLQSYRSQKTILDMKKTSEIMKLKEVVLLYLNDSLPSGCVREMYYAMYPLQ